MWLGTPENEGNRTPHSPFPYFFSPEGKAHVGGGCRVSVLAISTTLVAHAETGPRFQTEEEEREPQTPVPHVGKYLLLLVLCQCWKYLIPEI